MISIAISALAFSGSAAPCRVSRSAVQMSDTRRELLVRSVTAVGGLVLAAEQASAKYAEGPKVSIFGISFKDDYVTQSSPFEIDTKIGKGTPIASKEKYANFAAKLGETEKRISVEVPKYIKKETWALGRGQMRSMMGAMRQSMTQVNKSQPAEKLTKATALYRKFIRDVEDLDYAMQQKDKDAALAAQTSAVKSLGAWKSFITPTSA